MPAPESNDLVSHKKTIRKRINAQRKLLSQDQRMNAAIAVWQQVIQQPFFDTALRIGFYQPVRGELDPQPIFQTAMRFNKRLYLPVVKDNDAILHFYRYIVSMKMIQNKYGILEPSPMGNKQVDPLKLDLVFVPLVAFDALGHRLGMGKGYYDRTFANRTPSDKPILVGLAYEFQQVDDLPFLPHDVLVDYVVTNKTIYKCKGVVK